MKYRTALIILFVAALVILGCFYLFRAGKESSISSSPALKDAANSVVNGQMEENTDVSSSSADTSQAHIYKFLGQVTQNSGSVLTVNVRQKLSGALPDAIMLEQADCSALAIGNLYNVTASYDSSNKKYRCLSAYDFPSSPGQQ